MKKVTAGWFYGYAEGLRQRAEDIPVSDARQALLDAAKAMEEAAGKLQSAESLENAHYAAIRVARKGR